MARRTVEFLLAQEQCFHVRDVPHALLGLALSQLSFDTQTGAITLYGRTPAFWSPRARLIFASESSVLVLDGDLTIGEHNLERGSFAIIGAGRAAGPMYSKSGCKMMIFSEGEFRPSITSESPSVDAVTVINAIAEPWQASPVFEGRSADEVSPGLSMKWLHRNEDTGAYVLMTRQAPGWRDPRIESHHCWEELLLLQGDYLMGPTGQVTGGAYIFREAGIPHGPQCTRTGAVWFCRGNQEIDFQYESVAWATPLMDSYLDNINTTVRQLSPQSHAPWGDWYR